jgi:hypothetical protein
MRRWIDVESWREQPPQFVAACAFLVVAWVVNGAMALLRLGGMLPAFSWPMAVFLTAVAAVLPGLLVARHVYRLRVADAEVRALRDAIERHEREGRGR